MNTECRMRNARWEKLGRATTDRRFRLPAIHQGIFAALAFFCLVSNAFALTNSTTGWWKLDNGTGSTATDSSSNTNHGSLVDSPTWMTGVQSNALSFTTTGQRVSIDHKSYYNLTNSITLSVWIRPNSIPTNNARFFTKGIAHDDAWGLMMDPSGYIVFQMTAVNGNSLSSISKPSTNRWTHVAATFSRTDGKKAKLYINGILEGTATFSGNMLNNSSNVRLGGHTAVLPGRVDDARLFNIALTENDIIQLSFEFDRDFDRLADVDDPNSSSADTDADGFSDGLESRTLTDISSGSSKPDTNTILKGNWTLNETNGTTAADSTGLGSDGTLANGPVWVTNGIANGGLFFDGNNDQVTCGVGGSGSPLAVTSITISCWMYVTNTTLQANPVNRKSASGGAGYALSWQADNNRAVLQMPSSPNTEVNLSEITYGAWHHYTFTYDGTTSMEAFLDGWSRNTGSYTNALGSSTNALFLARNVSGGQRFNGILDEVRVYGRALSFADVLALAEIDTDGDGLLNSQETRIGTSPNSSDSDGDGMPDGWEVKYGLNPLTNDANGHLDGDGVTNLDEYLQGRDPTKNAVADTGGVVNLVVFTPLE